MIIGRHWLEVRAKVVSLLLSDEPKRRARMPSRPPHRPVLSGGWRRDRPTGVAQNTENGSLPARKRLRRRPFLMKSWIAVHEFVVDLFGSRRHTRRSEFQRITCFEDQPVPFPQRSPIHDLTPASILNPVSTGEPPSISNAIPFASPRGVNGWTYACRPEQRGRSGPLA